MSGAILAAAAFPPPIYAECLLPRLAMAIQERTRRCAVRSVMMRAGTSKGLFFRREDLPRNVSEWSPIILGAMGSLDNDLRQLNGVGGGSSTTSKVAVVARSKRPNVDVDYTFIQVPVGRGELDFSGNCGNMVSGVGPFAVDEGMVMTDPGASKVGYNCPGAPLPPLPPPFLLPRT